MDPCPFVRLVVGNLALKIPVAARPSPTVVHPSTSPCFCKIRLKNFPQQMVVVPLIPPENAFPDGRQAHTIAASFHLTASDLDRLVSKSIFAGKPHMKIAIYTGRRGTTCGVSSGRLIGKVSVPLDLAGTESRSAVFHNGWISVGKGAKGDGATASAQLHLSVWAEPDPRFVFEFEGEPECSPQVSLIQGSIRQPVFTCKFSFGNNGDRTMGSRSMHSDPSNSRSWLSSLGSERERPGKERKGWSITVHELSGSPVALASIVTPFVACPGSDRVSRSNPGAWLILRLGDGTWKPWGRLEAWRERGSSDGLGYRFELLPDMSATAAGIVLAESTLSTSKGGKFVIDMAGNGNGRSMPASSTSPVCSPQSSGDYGHLWPFAAYRGFVISSTVEGEGKCSRPVVEVGVQHVGCSEDAAVFVALSAAIDMSMDACKLFSHKLRKELCPPQQEFI
ncbi:Formin-like protein 18 [Cinnamomum micranthum f. kanehirae]|uniref:Formin-like protein 18 n=1 Tax=Cinnamomum micranthum f. kanehirae TaxID=337451 RepID=A0A443N655_9MAGN|nr:Formin-like protein 18 [Cinnamomum micranthum f. kanehirae]